MDDRHKPLRDLPFETVARVIDADLSRFRQRKNGNEWAGPCPIHRPKKNSTSFSYSADGKWNCFSCNKHGKGAIDLCMAVRSLGFQEAVEWLRSSDCGFSRPTLRQLPPQVQQPEPKESEKKTSNPAFRGTYEKFKVPSPWLEARGLTQATLDRFQVFQYDNPKRKSVYSGSVMLKISRYSDGECTGYVSRNIGEITPEKPKYLLPKGLHKGLELWGAFQLKGQSPLRYVYVVESPFSVMHFHQLGFPAVALLGWSVSGGQLEILKQLAKGCIFLPDLDKAADALPHAGFIASQMWCKMPKLPEGITDPEQLTKDLVISLT